MHKINQTFENRTGMPFRVRKKIEEKFIIERLVIESSPYHAKGLDLGWDALKKNLGRVWLVRACDSAPGRWRPEGQKI